MKILATGDWHAGVPSLDLAEQQKVWHRIVDAALEHDVDLFLHGGDVFEGRGSHGAAITPEQTRAVLDPLLRLTRAEIPVVILLGNGVHDLSTRVVHGLDVLAEVPGIRISDRAENIEIGECVISTLPWTKFGRDENAAHQLAQIGRVLHDQATDERPNHSNILTAHWSISSANLPNGLPVDQLPGPVLEWADLDAIGFDAIVAAHIHKAQRLDDPALGDQTPGVYVGSPQPLNHGESGYEHGVWLLDVEPGAVSLEFLPIESPQFVTLDIDPLEDSVLAINGREARGFWSVQEDSIVRVRYTATREQDATIDKDAIRRELLAAGASRVSIEPSITREVRARVETMTQDLSAQDALAAYCEAQKIEPSVRVAMAERLAEWID